MLALLGLTVIVTAGRGRNLKVLGNGSERKADGMCRIGVMLVGEDKVGRGHSMLATWDLLLAGALEDAVCSMHVTFTPPNDTSSCEVGVKRLATLATSEVLP
jgi:hypothetical protein